jgi:hypothetical protein
MRRWTTAPAVQEPFRPSERDTHAFPGPLLPAAQEPRHPVQELARLALGGVGLDQGSIHQRDDGSRIAGDDAELARRPLPKRLGKGPQSAQHRLVARRFAVARRPHRCCNVCDRLDLLEKAVDGNAEPRRHLSEAALDHRPQLLVIA